MAPPRSMNLTGFVLSVAPGLRLRSELEKAASHPQRTLRDACLQAGDAATPYTRGDEATPARHHPQMHCAARLRYVAGEGRSGEGRGGR